MKKIIILLTILTTYYLLLTTTSNAQPSPTSPANQQIKDQLIENIASRVAQLKLVEKRGFIGTVTDVSNTQITLSDTKNNTRFVDVDELTKFSSPSAKDSFGISDITKETTLGVLGLYNKESRRLLARFVNVLTLPRFIHGQVIEVDSANRTLNILGKDGENTKVDIGKSTRILSYTKNGGLTRALFSEANPNQRIIVIGFPDLKNKEIIIAERIILFPEFPSIPRLNETTTPSTENGERVAPITK